GIFAVRFFGASPAGLTGQIENGSKALLRTTGAYLLCSGREDVMHQSRIPSGRKRNRLRIGRSLGRSVAVQTLLLEEDGDSQTRVFDDPLLQCVGELCHFSGSAVLAGARHLAQAIFQKKSSTIRQKFAILADKQQRLVMDNASVLPAPTELRDLFLQRHTSQQ